MDLSGVQDLCTLPELTDSSILSCLEQRHQKDRTYTSVGEILVSLRPSQPLMFSECDPNPLLLVDRAVSNLIANQCDQSIILYGTHGSGKTAIADKVLRGLLTTVSSQDGFVEDVIAATSVYELFSQLESQLSGCLRVTSLGVDAKAMKLTGCQFSSLLLDVDYFMSYKVFSHLRSGDRTMETSLGRLGMTEDVRGSLESVLMAVMHMCSGSPDVGLVAGLLGVSAEGLAEHTSSFKELAAVIYQHLFRWSVCWLNSRLCGDQGQCNIAVVDMVGMPPSNGTLYTLLSGYCSEVLYNIYCQRVFVWEQDQYGEEGVEWERVDVEFNDPIISTFQESKGVLDILSCSDVGEMVGKLAVCCCGTEDISNEFEDTFVVSHYTGEQSYSIDARWCNQPLCPRIIELLSSSSNKILREIAHGLGTWSPDVVLGQSLPASTPSGHVQEGMSLLYDWIMTSCPHFVLCIRPSECEDVRFDADCVLHQLQHLRVLDTALIQSCGYSVQMTFADFLSRYSSSILRETELEVTGDNCRRILQVSRLQEWQIGHTKVLLKVWHLDQLDSIAEIYLSSATKQQQAYHRQYPRRYPNRRSLSTDPELLEEDMVHFHGYDHAKLQPMDGLVDQKERPSSVTLTLTLTLTSEDDPSSEEQPEDGVQPVDTVLEENIDGLPPEPPPRPAHTFSSSSSQPPPPSYPPPSSQPPPPSYPPPSSQPPPPSYPPPSSQPPPPSYPPPSSQPPPPSYPPPSSQPPPPSYPPPSSQPPPPSYPPPSSQPPPPSYPPPSSQPPYLKLINQQNGHDPPVVEKREPKRPSWGKPKPGGRSRTPPSLDQQTHFWFHGRISREAAEKRLKLIPYDTFLVRESENRVGQFSLSLCHGGSVKHFRIDCRKGSGRYELYGAHKSFPTLPVLVEYYSQHCVSTGGEMLTTPCPTELQGLASEIPPPLPPPRKRNLSTIRRPKDSLPPVPSGSKSAAPPLHRTKKRMSAPNVSYLAPGRSQSLSEIPDLSDETIEMMDREVKKEERIVEAARRLAELPSTSKKDRQQRRDSLKQAQARLLILRQQYHTVLERRRFLDISLSHTSPHSSPHSSPKHNRRVSDPSGPPLPPRR